MDFFHSKIFNISSAGLVTFFGSIAAFDWTPLLTPGAAAKTTAVLGLAKVVASIYASTPVAPHA